MRRWIMAVWRRVFGTSQKTSARSDASDRARTAKTVPPDRRSYPTMPLRQHLGSGRPPRLHWKPSHPSTIKRFKAEVTCSRGHAIALRDHTVEADGRVVPSVVCKQSECDFHEIVRLEDWNSGTIPADAERRPAEAA